MHKNNDYGVFDDEESYYEIEIFTGKKQRINKIVNFAKDIHKRNIFKNLFSF